MDRQISVSLTTAQWSQVLGMINNGSKMILSQLAMQDGSLPKVAELSAIAHNLLAEISKQVEASEITTTR